MEPQQNTEHRELTAEEKEMGVTCDCSNCERLIAEAYAAMYAEGYAAMEAEAKRRDYYTHKGGE